MRLLPPLMHINNLLIVKTSSIGDVIHALPVVQALHNARPEMHIGWVVRARCADILCGCPFIGNLYVVPDKPSLSDLRLLRRELRAVRYNAALDMQGLALSGLITWLSGAPTRVGWDRNREGNALFLTYPVVPGRDADKMHTGHEIDLLFGFAQALGVEPAYDVFPVQDYLAADGREQVREWLKELPHPRIALNVGSSRAAKRWPVENWVSVAEKLLSIGAGIVFVGSTQDQAAVADVRAQMQIDTDAADASVLDLSGQTTLRTLASVLAECDLVVSADSGPLHLAVAIGTSTVALFGGTDPARHGPYGKGHIILHSPAPGAETPSRRPSEAFGAASMARITPAGVVEAAQTQLSLLTVHA